MSTHSTLSTHLPSRSRFRDRHAVFVGLMQHHSARLHADDIFHAKETISSVGRSHGACISLGYSIMLDL